MPNPADRLYPPAGTERTGARLVVPTIALSALTHAAALASMIGFAGLGTDDVRPVPIEVVFLSLPATPDATELPLTRAVAAVAAPRVVPATSAARPASVQRPTTVASAGAPAPNAEAAPAVQVPRPAAAEPSADPGPPLRVAASPSIEAVAVVRIADPMPTTRPPQPALRPPRAAKPPQQVRTSTPKQAVREAARVRQSPQSAEVVQAAVKQADVRQAEAPTSDARPPRTTLAARTASDAVEAPPSRGKTTPPDYVLGSDSNPAPEYPRRARLRGWEGRVVLRVAIDARGQPLHVDVQHSSGHAVLDSAAHRTVADWRFQPATRSGRPVPGEAIVPVVFRLN